ncbi:MAG: outer membrane beta-barrel protein [Bacteroidales bacterium]|nr:outer membrane beta-barrel protein [Bacteroidales bacterium]
MKGHAKALKTLFLTAFVLFTLIGIAQPPGGRYPGGGGGRFPGGRPPMGGDRQWNQQNTNPNPTVKPKKKVRVGDTFTVVGVLRDAKTGEYLPFVNVAVLDSLDGSFIKGGITNMDGQFEISDVPQGPMLLRVSAIGYETFSLPFTVTNNTNLGVLRVKPGVISLNEVTVTGEKPIYAMDGEKLVYNVSEDPSIQTGTTEDALQNAPGVEVDVEGNITLRGVSSVEIWINDKPSKLTEENLKTYLQTLPANAIASIETITNPSAKYATEAEAVINIVTSAHIKSNQFVSFGVNGSNQPFVSPWISYMWKKDRLSINLFGSGRYSKRENSVEGWELRRRDGAIEGTYDSTWYKTSSQNTVNSSMSGNLFMNIDYEIDSTSDISVDAGGFYNNNRSMGVRRDEQTFFMLPVDSLLAYSIGDTTLSNSGFGHLGADYTKKFDENGHNLRIGLNTRINRNANDQWYDRFYEVYKDLDENRYLLTNMRGLGGSLDIRYNRPYSEDGELSYGLRSDYQQYNNDYQRFYSNDGGMNYDSIDQLRTYHFIGSDLGVNADVNWTRRWGGFTLSTGLGVGNDRVAYDYQSTMPFADKNVLYFWSARPSVHLTYRTEDMHNIKLNYSMRMSHPREEQISTYRRYGEDSYSTGNPNGLKNGFTHNVEAGWQKFFDRFGNIGVEAYGRLSTNEISSLTDSEYDEYLDRIVSYSMPYNMGTSWRYGTSINMTYRPTGFFNVRLFANVYDYGYRMQYPRVDEFGNTEIKTDQNDKWSFSVRVNAWAKIFDQYQFTMSANYNSPTISLMSERKARYFLNMGVRSDFFNRKMSVFVNVQDIFNWGAKIGSGSSNTNPYYLTDSTRKMLNSRYISAGVTFRFGKLELEQKAKEGDTETGDTLGE